MNNQDEESEGMGMESDEMGMEESEGGDEVMMDEEKETLQVAKEAIADDNVKGLEKIIANYAVVCPEYDHYWGQEDEERGLLHEACCSSAAQCIRFLVRSFGWPIQCIGQLNWPSQCVGQHEGDNPITLICQEALDHEDLEKMRACLKALKDEAPEQFDVNMNFNMNFDVNMNPSSEDDAKDTGMFYYGEEDAHPHPIMFVQERIWPSSKVLEEERCVGISNFFVPQRTFERAYVRVLLDLGAKVPLRASQWMLRTEQNKKKCRASVVAMMCSLQNYLVYDVISIIGRMVWEQRYDNEWTDDRRRGRKILKE